MRPRVSLDTVEKSELSALAENGSPSVKFASRIYGEYPSFLLPLTNTQ
jgi:hypothetical protein